MNARTWALPLLVVLASMASAAWARAEAEEDGQDAFVREVLARSPRLRAGVLRRGAFREEARASGTYPDPSVSVMVDRVPNRAPEGAEMPMIRYQVAQMVPWPGKLGLMRAAVERQEDAADADVDTQRLELRLSARRGLAMLLLNTRRREINRANRNLTATIASATLGRYSAGLGGHHEVARAQVEISALDIEYIDLEGERVSIVAMLNSLRDRPTDTAIANPTRASSPPAEPPLAALTARAINQRPELRGMRAMQNEALAMANLARKEPYPDLMGSAWVNQMMGAPITVGVMVGGTIPLFGISRQQHRAAAFDARADGAAQDQGAMRAMIRFEVADALVKVETAKRQLDLIENVALPKARESFEASLAGYGASTVDILGVLDARRALQNAERALAEAQVSLQVSLAELERAQGSPFSGNGGAP